LSQDGIAGEQSQKMSNRFKAFFSKHFENMPFWGWMIFWAVIFSIVRKLINYF